MTMAAIAVCVVLAALYAAGEHALARASGLRFEERPGGDRRRLSRPLSRHDELILCAAGCRVLLEAAAAVMVALHPGMAGEPPVVVFAVALGTVLVAAELIPRALVTMAPRPALDRLVPLVYWASVPLLPLAAGLLALARLIRRKAPGGKTVRSARGILSVVAEEEKVGAIAIEQADMIENIIELRNATVAEIMTPRPDMASVDLDAPLEETMKLALASDHTRLPVFRNTRDDIVGVLYVRDLVAALPHDAGRTEAVTTEKLMRPAYFVPETMRISDLLGQFQRRLTTFAIVVDEYGGTAGLVTAADIMDMVVGEIREHGQPPREPAVHVIDDYTLEADGRSFVRRLNETYGAQIPEAGEYDTIAGYVCCGLGRVPKAGDRHTSGGTEVIVVRADERRVQAVRITVKSGLHPVS